MKAILTYHSVDDSGSAVSVSPDAFRRHVRWLASERVRVVTVPQLPALPPAPTPSRSPSTTGCGASATSPRRCSPSRACR